MRVDKPLYGVLLILAAGFLLSCHDGISKHVTLLYPLLLVVWMRYLSQTLLMLALFGPSQRLNLVRTQRPWLQLARGLSLVGVSLLFFAALRYLPLGEATAVMFMAPLFVVLLSVLVLKERVSRGLWISVLCGLVGVLVIVRPGGALFTPAIVLPLGAALCFGTYQLLTRRLSQSDHPLTSNFISSLIGTLIMSCLVPFVWQTPQSLGHWLLLGALGALAMTGHLLLTHGYRFASAATLAPFTYGQIIFSSLLGMLVFGHVPDPGAILGMLIIIASGLGMAVVQSRTMKV